MKIQSVVLAKRKLTALQRQRLRVVDEFDYQLVKDKVSEHAGGLPTAYLDAGIWNLKLYYAVAILDPLNKHAVSRFTDPFWHCHIVFTRDYRRFCEMVCGHVIEHSPLDTRDAKQVAVVAALYRYTKECYRKLFAPSAIDETWWPVLTDNSILGGPVCLHQEISDAELRANALLPKNRQLPEFGRPRVDPFRHLIAR